MAKTDKAAEPGVRVRFIRPAQVEGKVYGPKGTDEGSFPESVANRLIQATVAVPWRAKKRSASAAPKETKADAGEKA